MHLPMLFKDLGPGRFFGHGRLFGIHVHRSELGKAFDPYINIRTLASLSCFDEKAIRAEVPKELADAYIKQFREAIIDNIVGELKVGFNPNLLPLFNDDLIIEALIKVKELAPTFIVHSDSDRDGELHSILVEMMKRTFTHTLAGLIKSPSLKVRIMAAGIPRTPREVLLDAARSENNLAGINAFITADKKSPLTADELDDLASSINPMVLLKVLEHPQTSRKTIIKMAVEAKKYEYEGRTYNIGMEAYQVIEKKELTADELRQIADTMDWTILLKAIAQPAFPRDLKLRLVIGHNPRLAEEAWKNLDKRSLTPEELRAMSQTSSGLAKIEIDHLIRSTC